MQREVFKTLYLRNYLDQCPKVWIAFVQTHHVELDQCDHNGTVRSKFLSNILAKFDAEYDQRESWEEGYSRVHFYNEAKYDIWYLKYGEQNFSTTL